MGITINNYDNTENWEVNTDLQYSGLNSVHNAYGIDADNVLFMSGNFDFTGRTDVMLSFWQIAKTDGKSDHCYVEISTDGGTTFDQLPISTYEGTGRYREDDLYEPFDGPCFDEDSYTAWGTGNEIPTNDWWIKEYFNLTDYNTFDNVVIRFRLWSNAYTNKNGWYIDDIAVESMGIPMIKIDPETIVETLTPTNQLANIDMVIGNPGNFPLNFTANVVNDEVLLINETFDTGMPADWTINNNGDNDSTWRMYTNLYAYTIDGTNFAMVNGMQSYPYSATQNEEMITMSVDASSYSGLQLEYDQWFDVDYTAGNDTAKVFVYDGADWVQVYESTVRDGYYYLNQYVHKVWDLSAYANDNLMIKFQYIEGATNKQGKQWAIDNVKLRATPSAIDWLTLDGSTTISGIIAPDADGNVNLVDVKLDASNLVDGIYRGDIVVTSDDPNMPVVFVPVTLIYWSPISNVVAYASPEEICAGSSVQLSIDLTGGSGAQTYSWTSDPAGFTSDIADPVVYPTVGTTYYIEVSEDGNTVSNDVTVVVNPSPDVTIGTFDGVCVDANAFDLTGGLPEGGVYSGMGVTDGMFNPANAGVGTFNITYTYSNAGGCENSASSSITVNDLPVVTMESQTACIQWAAFEITLGSPAGGEYSGTAVNNGMFDPAFAGEGEHTITYVYSDANGCENTADGIIYVDVCAGVNELSNPLNVNISPNPTSGVFSVKINAAMAEGVDLKVFNNIGKVVHEQSDILIKDNYSLDIDLTNQPKGMYYVYIVTKGNRYVKKVIIR